MTSRQAWLVQDPVGSLTAAWLRERVASDGELSVAYAMADLGEDCYVSRADFDVTGGDGRLAGKLHWRLDADFTPIGQPVFGPEEHND